jgi:hypothetical protein
MGIRDSDLRKLKKGSSGIGGNVDLYESKTPFTFEFVGDNDTFTYEFQSLRFMRGRTKAARQAEKVLPSVLGLDFIMDNLNMTSNGRQFTIETRI